MRSIPGRFHAAVSNCSGNKRYSRASRRIAIAVFAIAASFAGAAWADSAANSTVDAVGLETGLGAALDGSGVKLIVAEAGNGAPQLGNSAPANPVMPNSGPAGGANGLITSVTNTFLAAPTIVDHATMVNGVIMGTGAIAGGIAPNSQDFAVPIQNDPDIIQTLQGLLRSDTGPNASIINFSWTGGGTANTGNELDTSWQDWAALTNTGFLMHNKLFVDAGNETGGGAGGRTEPWDNFNGITVGATTGPGTQFLANYNLSNKTADGRFKTDIVAPGGGTAATGTGNVTSTMQSPVVKGGANDNALAAGQNDGINSNSQFAGTSFAAPLVTGAASLLTQEATADGYANIDHNALKALILNGASKNVFNGATKWTAFGANGTKGPGGATPVNIGWDANLGTGLLDVGNSQANLDAGQFAPGNVPLEGWDYESAAATNMKAAGNTANYIFQSTTTGLNSITATLDWDRRDQLVKKAGNTNTQLWEPGNGGDTFSNQAAVNPTALNDLDLKLFDLTTGLMVYQSDSALDSIEHIFYTPDNSIRFDKFELQVNYFAVNDTSFVGANIVPYGLAWDTTVPEPTVGTILVGGLVLLARRRRALERTLV